MLVAAALFLATAVLPASGDSVIDLCQDNCATIYPILGWTSGVAVKVIGCAGDTVNVTLQPPAQEEEKTTAEGWSFRVTDLHRAEMEHVIYYTDSPITARQNVYSLSNTVDLVLEWEEEEVQPTTHVFVSCLKKGTIPVPDPNNHVGNKSLQLVPNIETELLFSSINLHSFGLNFSSGDAIGGFALTALEDGTYALAASNTSQLVYNPHHHTSIHLFTVGQQVTAEVSWDLGKEVNTPTSATPTSTTAPPDKNEETLLFVLVVNEEQFVTNHLEGLVTWTKEIFTSTCDNLNLTVVDLLGPVVSCRQSCFMTDNPDRGCVKVVLDLTDFPRRANCSFAQGAHTPYLRQELEKALPDFTAQFQASQVVLDSCTSISVSSPWVLGAIGITAASLVLALVILFLARWVTRSRRRWIEESVGEGLGVGYTSMKASHWEVS